MFKLLLYILAVALAMVGLGSLFYSPSTLAFFLSGTLVLVGYMVMFFLGALYQYSQQIASWASIDEELKKMAEDGTVFQMSPEKTDEASLSPDNKTKTDKVH